MQKRRVSLYCNTQKMIIMKTKLLLTLFALLSLFSKANELPNPAMVGYWENWNGNRFVNLKDIDDRYNVVCIAFAQIKTGTSYDMEFYPPNTYSDSIFKSEIELLQAKGKKIIISIGGQNDHIFLDTEAEKDQFVISMNAIIDEWGYDGLDIDLEGSSLNFSDINTENPGDSSQIWMIDAIKEIMANHYTTHGEKLILTMAPETYFVHGGMSSAAVGQYRGAYLPILEALRDSIDMLNVQLYNSGSMYGVDGPVAGAFSQGNADWVVAMTEAVIMGFTASDSIGEYHGMDPSKVGVALPGCHSYDAVPHAEIEKAINYLRGMGPQAGTYKMKNDSGYPTLRGMMTWSINSDRKCYPEYGFVDTWSKLFTDSAYITLGNYEDIYEGDEAGKRFVVNLHKDYFALPLDTSKWTVGGLPEGVFVDSLELANDSTVHVILGGVSTTPYLLTNFTVSVSVDSSQFSRKSEVLSRGIGVTLKKQRTTIPGRLEGEACFEHFNAGIGKTYETDSNYYKVDLYTNDWANYEVYVEQTGLYNITFRYAASATNCRFAMKIDGYGKLSKTISNGTGWRTWQTVDYQATLDSGNHVLQLLQYENWLNVDYIDFSIASSTEEVSNAQFTLAPNPATNSFSVLGEGFKSGSVLDQSGRVVRAFPVGSDLVSIDVADLSPGLYIVILESYSGSRVSKRLIKR